MANLLHTDRFPNLKADSQLRAVFDAIRQLMTPPVKKRPIGYASWEEKK